MKSISAKEVEMARGKRSLFSKKKRFSAPALREYRRLMRQLMPQMKKDGEGHNLSPDPCVDGAVIAEICM